MALLAAILLVLVYLTRVRTGLLNAGPYNLKLDRYELCEDMGTAEYVPDWWMVKKSTHKTFLHGPVTVPFDFDDTVKAELKFSRFGSGGWGKNAYRETYHQFCSTFKRHLPAMFDFYYKGWGIKNPSCPIKAGNYTVDMDTDWPRLARLPLLPYGRYKLVYELFRGNPPVMFMCNIFYITCSERPR